jgi:hypothetical protein
MALRDAVTRIAEAIKDLSSLHVQTFSGTVAIDLANLDANDAAIDTIRSTITSESAKPDGTIRLVAEAYYQFDGDSYNFLTNDAVPEGALEMHAAAVDAGIKTRQGLVELVKGAVK